MFVFVRFNSFECGIFFFCKYIRKNLNLNAITTATARRAKPLKSVPMYANSRLHVC